MKRWPLTTPVVVATISIAAACANSGNGKLNGTPMPSRAAAQLVEVLARAMHAAHCRHIVHRGLKPVHGILRPEAAWYRRQSLRRHRVLHGCPAAGQDNKLTWAAPTSFS